MGQISNLRYPKVFVLDPATELIVANTEAPTDLTTGQVGIFNPLTGLGIGTGPAPDCTTVPVIEIHQNLGDSKFGTTRTKKIAAQKVRGWHAVKATAATNQTTYIGYDEADANKQLVAYKGQTIEIAITIFSNELTKWFGPRGYTHRIVVDPATQCIPCQANCDLLVEDDLAQWIVDYINGANAPAGNFPVTLELKNYLTATKVSTSTKRGVKIVSKVVPIELINSSDPKQFHKPELVTFSVGIPYSCPNFPITTTVKAKAAQGVPLQVLDLEKESQGYDRVRESFEYAQYMKTNYITRAANGSTYDFYYLEFDASHQDSGIPKEVSDPYIVVFCVPTGQGDNLQAAINAWLAPLGFPAVDITGAQNNKGSEVGDGIDLA